VFCIAVSRSGRELRSERELSSPIDSEFPVGASDCLQSKQYISRVFNSAGANLRNAASFLRPLLVSIILYSPYILISLSTSSSGQCSLCNRLLCTCSLLSAVHVSRQRSPFPFHRFFFGLKRRLYFPPGREARGHVLNHREAACYKRKS
jgi:hypothetical protein